MGEQTEISWTDHTFNPWQGCAKVPGSGACDHCYAETLSIRIGKGNRWGPDGDRVVTSDNYWRNPERRWKRIAEERQRPGLVFCGSMCDIFEDRPDLASTRRRLFALIDRTPHLRWMLLTKRPENVEHLAIEAGWHDGCHEGHDSSCLGDLTAEVWPDHVWLGCTVEDQAHADERIPRLLDLPATVHFVSAEPLLGPINLAPWLHDVDCLTVGVVGGRCTCRPGADPRRGRRIDWVIAGGESGLGYRPIDLDHARALRDQVAASPAAFFFKQVGGLTPKAGGHELDGEIHHVWPPQAGHRAEAHDVRPKDRARLAEEWTCSRCGLPIVLMHHGEPHTDPATGDDVHDWCCASCHPGLAEAYGITLDATTADLEHLAAGQPDAGRFADDGGRTRVLGHGGGLTSEQAARGQMVER